MSLASRLALIEEAAGLAGREEGETRRLLLAAARSQLGAVDERFAVAGGEKARILLREADGELRRIRFGEAAMGRWRRHWPSWKLRLLNLESASLFDSKRLDATLRRDSP